MNVSITDKQQMVYVGLDGQHHIYAHPSLGIFRSAGYIVINSSNKLFWEERAGHKYITERPNEDVEKLKEWCAELRTLREEEKKLGSKISTLINLISQHLNKLD